MILNNGNESNRESVEMEPPTERLRLYGGFALFTLNRKLMSHSFHAVSNDKDRLIHLVKTSQPIQKFMAKGWQLLMLKVHLISDDAVATAYCDGNAEFNLAFESSN